MKKKIILIFVLLLLLISNYSFSSTEETINEQVDSFEINSFISKSKDFTNNEIFEENDINQIFESAVKGQINNKSLIKNFSGLLGKEFKNTLGTVSIILTIIVIHSFLKSICENLENDTIVRLIYYVQYILIATIIMNNFSQIITIVKESTGNMIGFINMLLPVLTSLMVFTGSITTTSMLEPTILFTVNILGNLIQNILIPLVFIIASFSIISKISDKIQIDKISKLMKSGVIWVLGIILTVFVAVTSLEGTLTSSVDGISAKTTKAVVSSAIPIVGKILGDAVDSVLGCGIILKNAVGIVGVVILVGIAIIPVLKLAMLSVTYKVLARYM